ncbi:MAG: Mov34/MPN/PAD-1 family protein [Geminicoccaceae bacterium]
MVTSQFAPTAAKEQDLPRQPFPIVRHEFRVFFEESVFDEIDQRANSEREVGGVLLGDILTDDGGPYVYVDVLIHALHADERGAEVTFTHETWTHITRTMDRDHPGKQIVGWYHTHPGFGIFLSEQDQFIHRNFFPDWHQLALVYDPVSREHGVFRRHQNEIWRMRRYWVGVGEHVWDGARQGDSPTRSAPEPVKKAESSTPEQGHPAQNDVSEQIPDSLRNSLIGALPVMAALIALLGGLAGFWVGQQRAMIEARVEGAQDAVASLNADLLTVIQGVLQRGTSNDVLVTSADQLTEIANSVDGLQAKQRILSIREDLRTAHHDAAAGSELFKRLGSGLTASETIIKKTAQEVLRHQKSIPHIYQTMASILVSQDEGQAAQKLLAAAARHDPSNKQSYQRFLNQLKESAE